VKGELVGGCDIIIEMYQSGELKTLISETAANNAASE
jgi:monothiol glutaredoxin